MRQRLEPRVAKTQRASAWLVLIALAASAGLASCGDGGGPAEPNVQQPEGPALPPPPRGVTVSEPVAASGGAAALAAAADGVVYISASPGTFPDGLAASITNLATGESANVVIQDGGFDPIALMGSAGDELEIFVRNLGGSTTVVRTTVPIRKRPRVVRTQPSKDATDVVLRSSVIVVFTEPVEERTVTLETVKLLLDGEPVDGTLALSDDRLRANLTPAEALAPERAYTLVVTTGVADQAGDPLEQQVEVSFTTESAPPAPPEGVVAFERFFVSEQTSTVYRMNFDGTGLVALAEGGKPAWSPDGSKIAFERDHDIYVMNADGSGAVNLTNSPSRFEQFPPAWSPDGSKIAYTAKVFLQGGDKEWDVYVMNADGSGQTNLTVLTNQPGLDGLPTWSPDGSKIAFDSDRDGASKIYVMDADGSNVAKLTNFEACCSAWSPDGSKIAFDRGREVYVMNADGTGAVNLTNHPAPDRWAAWSPDGTKIVFSSYRGTPVPGDPPFHIYVMNADGSGVLRITPAHDFRDTNPDWRP